jgi:prolyl oligopeptidase PreP (S9A serine peptidase family)
MAWVEQQNARTRVAWCKGARFDSLTQRLAAAYLPHERPVIPDRWQDWAYDLWQDERNPKGIWRLMGELACRRSGVAEPARLRRPRRGRGYAMGLRRTRHPLS